MPPSRRGAPARNIYIPAADETYVNQPCPWPNSRTMAEKSKWILELFYSDGLGDVPGLVHIASAADGNVVGQELKRDDGENRSKNLRRGRNFNDVGGSLAGEAVTFGHDRDDDAVAGLHFRDVRDSFLVAGHGGGIGFITSGDDDDGKIFVDQRIGAVFHLACGITFGMDVGNLFELQGAFERNRVVDATAEIKEIGVTKELAAEGFVFVVALQNRFELVRQTRQFLNDALRCFL